MTGSRKHTTQRFALGDRVRITGIVQKVHEGQKVLWESKPVPQLSIYAGRQRRIKTFDEGVVVGRRTLAEFKAYKENDGWGISYDVSEQIPGTARRAWLVAIDLHRKPVLVLDEQIEPADDKIRLAEEARQEAWDAYVEHFGTAPHIPKQHAFEAGWGARAEWERTRARDVETKTQCSRKPWCTKRDKHIGACYPFHDPERKQRG